MFLPIAFFVANLLLPGAWIAFSSLFARFDGWTRLLFSAGFSIGVASAEYEVLRAFGAGSDEAVRLLAILNLPALILIWRARQGFTWPGTARAAAILFALALPIVFLALVFAGADEKAFWGHAWLHTDMIYALRDHPFAPEERQLAGLTSTYPWFGHLFFLIQSTALDLSPLESFTWINLVLAGLYGGFAMACVKRLGGGLPATLAAPFLFAFAVNPVGVLGGKLLAALGPAFARWGYLLGDPRYDFLLIKHMRLNLNQVAITLLAGLIILAVEPRGTGREARLQAWSLAAMVTAISLAYPLYLPVALGIALARVVALTVVSPAPDQPGRAAALHLAAYAAFGAFLAALVVVLPLGPRATGVGMSLSVPGAIWRNGIAIATAVSLPGIAAFWTWRRQGATRPLATTVLLLSALGCAILAVGLHIPNKDNEYKFVLAAGVVLMPFLCLALDRIFKGLPRAGAWTASGALVAICLYGAIDSVSRRSFEPETGPEILAYRGLFQDLEPAEPLAGALAAIRRDTPEDAVLVAPDTDLELSVLTLRSQYVPYDPARKHPGLTFRNDFLLADVKGYDARLIAARRKDVVTLYDGRDDAARARVLTDIARLGRAVVLLVAPGRNARLAGWLARMGQGRGVFRDDTYLVWLFPPAR
ncbi:hypothetical protein [Defluviimonas sp. SAOS-178_SWC]|uniref:hypothetical protein n=1 Tax=Defluviimonas sp. SAOS-178_SWC TaxID=3121287 RepID=UPI0032218744